MNGSGSEQTQPSRPGRWPANRIALDEVDSTSLYLRRALADASTAPELPVLVRAKNQTAGRGRGSHRWWSDSGSLTFTLALSPKAEGLRLAHEPRLAIAAAVALVNAVSRWCLDASLGIRWPNDVVGDGRKLAGILPERLVTPAGPVDLLGIGLNVNTRLDQAPSDVQRRATSMALLADRSRIQPPVGLDADGGLADPKPDDLGVAPDLDMEAVLEALLIELRTSIGQLANDDPQLVRRWQRLDVLNGRRVVHETIGQPQMTGLARGIAEDGGLRVETGGRIVRLYGGSILRNPDEG